MKNLVDVQNQRSESGIDIDKVGICDLHYPITVLDRKNGTQPVNATIEMYADLSRERRGIHMSRFIEVLNRNRDEITLVKMGAILEEMVTAFSARSVFMRARFEYFIAKEAPISGQESLLGYLCGLEGSFSVSGGHDRVLEVNVPVMSLCPCSKELSEVGAHNQRSVISLRVRFGELVWIEDLVGLVEEHASAELYTLLKRADEKHVVDRAFANPRFVEDVVRLVARRLEALPAITWFAVQAKHFESIHNHNAFASIERGTT